MMGRVVRVCIYVCVWTCVGDRLGRFRVPGRDSVWDGREVKGS